MPSTLNPPLLAHMRNKKIKNIEGAILDAVELFRVGQFRHWSTLIGPGGCYRLSDWLKILPLRNLTRWRHRVNIVSILTLWMEQFDSGHNTTPKSHRVTDATYESMDV